MLSAPLIHDLTRITVLASVGRERRSGVVLQVDPGAALRSRRATQEDVRPPGSLLSNATDTTSPSNGEPDAAALVDAIERATQAHSLKYNGISWSDASLTSTSSAVTSSTGVSTDTHISADQLGRLEREAQRQEAAASAAVSAAKALIALGDGKVDPADVRYTPLAHALHVWRAICIDGGDELRRVLVRSHHSHSPLSF